VKDTNPISAQSRLTKSVVLICLLLVTWFAFAEATHFHSFSSSGAGEHCEFCIVAHANAAAVPVASMPVVVPEAVSDQVVLVEESKAKSFLWASHLYIRPPPLV
jgi:hypothetical protein